MVLLQKRLSGTRKVYVTLKILLEATELMTVMADLDEVLIFGFVEF